MKTPRERYQNDNHFRVLVDLMVAHIDQCKYTPSEMREAAIMASIIYEEHRLMVNPSLLNVHLEAQLREVHSYLDKNQDKMSR